MFLKLVWINNGSNVLVLLNLLTQSTWFFFPWSLKKDLVHGLEMQMAAGRCYTVFDHVPHGVTARMAYKKCRGYTSNGGRP